MLEAVRARGYRADMGHRDSWLRQVIVTEPTTGEQVSVDLGQDYRQQPPVIITGLGPVIALSDAAASKARALNDRRAARDYLDLHVLLSREGWSVTTLFQALRDQLRPTITVEEFADDLAAAADQDPEDYAAYNLAPTDIARISRDFLAWAQQLRGAED